MRVVEKFWTASGFYFVATDSTKLLSVFLVNFRSTLIDSHATLVLVWPSNHASPCKLLFANLHQLASSFDRGFSIEFHHAIQTKAIELSLNVKWLNWIDTYEMRKLGWRWMTIAYVIFNGSIAFVTTSREARPTTRSRHAKTIIIIIRFFRNWLFWQSVNTRYLHSTTRLSGRPRRWSHPSA